MLEKRVCGNREVSGRKSHLAYVPVGGHAVGSMLDSKHVLLGHPVLLGWGGLGEGIRKDLHGYKGKTVNFEAFDLADVKIIHM